MPAFPRHPAAYRELVADRFRWSTWEALIGNRDLVIDRPACEPHPDPPEIIYPLDYGYIPDTVSTDGEPIDCFVGTGNQGLVGALLTTDYREGDREAKLLINCTPPEIYMAHGFINFDRTLLEGVLVLRSPMHTLWRDRNA
jgi:inorganic pyrophosphatase